MKYWIVTDTHFNHENIKKYCNRPDNFEALIYGGLCMIPESATLIHLGDVCIGKDEDCHVKYIMTLPVKERILVRGNHDKKTVTWYQNHGWTAVYSYLKVTVKGGKQVLLSHMPTADLTNISYNIHGHFHNSVHRESAFKDIYNEEKHRLLALEYTNYQPVELETFLGL